MLGVVEEPSGKAALSTVLDHEIFDTAVDDDDGSRKSWKNEKIVKKVITSTPEKIHVDNTEEDHGSINGGIGEIIQSSSLKNNTLSQDSDNESDSSTNKGQNRLLIFDSDDDDDDEYIEENGEKLLGEIKSNGQPENEKDMSDDVDNDDDGGEQAKLIKSNGQPEANSSDGDDSDDDMVLSTFRKKNRSLLDSDCDDDDDNDDKPETPMRKKNKKAILESDDESDDEEEKRGDDSEDEEKEKRVSDTNDVEEEMDDGEEMIRAKSTKSRSDRELKPRRAKKIDVQNIHSESQRIVRESVVSLPYHKPKPLSLDDFFNKKPIIKELKPIKGKIPTRKRKMQKEEDSKEINLTLDVEDNLVDGKEIEKHNKSPKLDNNDPESTSLDEKLEQINDNKENEKKSRFTPSRTKLKLQKEVVALTPTLRGGPNDFIDFDDSGNGGHQNKGLETLMNRFLKHTEKPKVRTPQQVQLSVIQKETTEDGKQELKCNKFTVLLDGEKEIDTKMQAPGAKLSKLKEALQAKMKLKRDQERKKRQEAYQLDNEEGFEDDFMDDDAELTDKTDTDMEEEDGDMGIEGIEREALEADDDDNDDDNDDDDDDDDDVVDDIRAVAGKTKTQKNADEFLSLKVLDTSIRSDPSASSGSSSFKTPAKVVTSINHSTDTMNLYDSTCSLPSDVSDPQPRDNDKNNSWKDFNFGLIEQKKGLIKHKSKDFGEYDFSDGENEMLKLAVESDKDMSDLKNVSYNGLDASFDPASMIPAYQPGGGSTNQDHNKSVNSGRNSPDFFTPFTKRQISTGSLQKSTGKLSDLSLPVEDSQDLFNSPPRSEHSRHSRNSDSQSQNFHFSLDDETQSQFLDENGFLNVRSTTKPKVSKRQLLLSDASNENLDELLGLCSGKFAEDTQESSSSSVKESDNPKPKGLFSHFSSGELASSCQRSSMDELLGLCSGTFTESSKAKMETTKDEDDDDGGSDVSFHIMSDVEDEEEALTNRKRRRVMQFSDDDDDEDDEMDHEVDEEELSEIEEESEQPKVKAKPAPMPDFIEDEAELSGSEAGSDDEEGDYGDDEYEEDAIDEEIPDADLLKNQINRIHMKTMEDDDARKLRLYKEMYLQDGDLWSDGKGRTRRFRWNNMEDESSSQMDMFWKASDNEESDQETEEDIKWRKERFEREQWVEEQKQDKDGVFDVDEDSQFTKIIKNIQIKKKAPPKELPAPPPPKEKTKDKEVTVPKPLHQTMFRRGSFLCRSKKDLEKIAAMAKPVANPSGPKHSRNFVFQALSPPKDRVIKKPQVRRSISVTGAVEQSISKRPRLERSQSTVAAKTSIFEHLD